MIVLSDSVALARPLNGPDLTATVTAFEQAKRGERDVEVRIGVGSLTGEIPLRVLGHAACLAEALRSDVFNFLSRPPQRMVLFSSAPKAGNRDVVGALKALVSLAGALRLKKVDFPIFLDLAKELQEIPTHLQIALPAPLADWLERAARHSGNAADPRWYGVEHAAPSMFGDLGHDHDLPLRITIGSATEARFWCVRMLVREAALRHGESVAPAVGFILKALKVPWYKQTCGEPPLAALKSSVTKAIEVLERAANPNPKYGERGNHGLNREARALRQFANLPGVPELVDAIETAEAAACFARESGFVIGTRLRSGIEMLP